MLLGGEKGSVLAKIRRVMIEPSENSKKLSLKSKPHIQRNLYGKSNLDKFWDKRYFLF